MQAAYQAGLAEGQVLLDTPLELAHVFGELHPYATDVIEVRVINL